MRVPLLLACAIAGAAMAADDAPGPGALESVLSVDRAFASLSLDRGQREAFLANLADDGLLFRPEAVRGREWLSSHEPASGRLQWTPAAGAVSCDGRSAVTTGPWTYTSADGKDVATGHYLSLWKLGADGRWQLVLDHGVDHEAGAAPDAALAAEFSGLWPGVEPRACRSSRSAETLAEAERNLGDGIRAQGLTAALSRAASLRALAYRDGGPPGALATVSAADDAAFGRGSVDRLDAAVADAGSNFGYTYGEIDAPSSAARALYIHLWQGDGRRWRLALDMTTMLPATESP